MKFNPNTKKLYTDKGEFIKQMHCPKDISWESMELTSNDLRRKCEHCKKEVLDTEFLKDEEVLFFTKLNPETCFRIKLLMEAKK
jgi:hypothetical protein